MTEPTDYGFKFQIGDVVKLCFCPTPQSPYALFVSEMRGLIAERYLIECPGGVQRFYSVRWANSGGNASKDVFKHNEIELVASEPFPTKPEDKDSGDSD